MAGVDLERQVVRGAEADQPPHDEVLKVLHVLRSELAPGRAEDPRGPLLRDLFEPQRPLIGPGRLEADGALGLGLAEQPVEDREVVVERRRPEALCACEPVGIVGGLLELGGVEPVEEGRDVEDQDLERVMGAEVEPRPSTGH